MLIVLATFALTISIESGVLALVGTDNRFLEVIPSTLRLGSAVLPVQGIVNLLPAYSSCVFSWRC
jgi:branched-chain amino acid transport system permease protein